MMGRRNKKLSLKWKLITLLAWTIDEAIDWIDVLGNPRARVGLMRYQRENWAKSLLELSKIGYIQKTIKKNYSVIQFTDTNKKLLLKEVPLARMQMFKWDRLWREVIFDIPEEAEKHGKLRTKIREKLIELGFGKLQESVWISPFDFVSELEEFFDNIGLSEEVKILEARYISSGSDRELASFVWPLNNLNKSYRIFISKWGKYNILNKTQFNNLQTEYFGLLFNDPALPQELLPNGWLGEKAKILFMKSLKIITLG